MSPEIQKNVIIERFKKPMKFGAHALRFIANYETKLTRTYKYQQKEIQPIGNDVYDHFKKQNPDCLYELTPKNPELIDKPDNNI